MKVGIGITVHNRQDVFVKSLGYVLANTQSDFKIVIVDDGSSPELFAVGMDYNVPEHSPIVYRFEKSVGIAAAKNKCLELLEDCDHIFLFDDDTYPLCLNWWEPYINSGQPHLMYIFPEFSHGPKLNDTAEIYRTDKFVAYSHPRGCMLYYHKSAIEVVGGMDTIFGKACHEHPDHSNRIFNAGLTLFRYMDVPNSKQLIYSGDEHRAVPTTWGGQARNEQIKRNTPIYQSRLNSTDFFPYKAGLDPKSVSDHGDADIILTSYFTGVPDPQGIERENSLRDCAQLADSVTKNGVDIHCLNDIFLNGQEMALNAAFCYMHTFKAQINPYFQRWVSYRQYLIQNREQLNFVFCVDATDVEMINNPFPHMKPGILYTGDEPTTIGRCEWLHRHHKNPRLQSFFKAHKGDQLLNAGLLGGDVDTVIDFCGKMIDIYTQCEEDAKLRKQPNAGMTDMGAFNYVASSFFNVEHGPHINTEFKKYDRGNKTAMFRHK